MSYLYKASQFKIASFAHHNKLRKWGEEILFLLSIWTNEDSEGLSYFA